MQNTVMTALATPYLDGKIDTKSLIKLVEHQQQNNVDVLLALGTTGEQAFLSQEEKMQVWQTVKKVATLPVWVGIDSSITAECIQKAKFWQTEGADGLLISPPSFVKCTPQGYYQHIAQIAQSVDIPLMLYNVPSRCGYQLDATALHNIRNNTTVRWLKDAGNKLAYTQMVSANWYTLSGNDSLLTQQMAVGAVGSVSVLSNAWPNLVRCAMQGNVPLWQKGCKAIYTQVNPIGIKYLLYKMGIFASYEMRLPLTKANSLLVKRVDRLVKYTGKEML